MHNHSFMVTLLPLSLVYFTSFVTHPISARFFITVSVLLSPCSLFTLAPEPMPAAFPYCSEPHPPSHKGQSNHERGQLKLINAPRVLEFVCAGSRVRRRGRGADSQE